MQGVFFRQSTYEKATKLGLDGTVQNLSDGSVEIHAQGEESKLEELLEWCREGSAQASVKEVRYIEQELRDYSDFSII